MALGPPQIGINAPNSQGCVWMRESCTLQPWAKPASQNPAPSVTELVCGLVLWVCGEGRNKKKKQYLKYDKGAASIHIPGQAPQTAPYLGPCP